MLCQFSFRNFLSYKDETVFDMQAASIPDLNASVIKYDKASDLLPVAAVYGPNGGGKSNLLKALGFLVYTVVKPVHDLRKTGNYVRFQRFISYSPFLFDEQSKNESSDFQIFFRTNGNEYRYNLAVLNEEIVSESLAWKHIGGKKTGLVFERSGNEIVLGASIDRNNVNKQVNPNMPYLSFLAINYDIPIISDVIKWFEMCIVQNFANPNQENDILVVANETKKMLFRILNDLDIDISDYVINRTDNMLYTVRHIDGKQYELHFEQESDGTQKLISFLPYLIYALHQGRLIVVDELDAKLHPKLLRYIIKLFHDPTVNKNGAQLIFTSHDLTTMKNDVFRRDEIWFACEDESHASGIYSLYDIRDEEGKHINNTAAYDKQYIEGRYGADPYLQNILGGEWDEFKAD